MSIDCGNLYTRTRDEGVVSKVIKGPPITNKLLVQKGMNTIATITGQRLPKEKWKDFDRLGTSTGWLPTQALPLKVSNHKVHNSLGNCLTCNQSNNFYNNFPLIESFFFPHGGGSHFAKAANSRNFNNLLYSFILSVQEPVSHASRIPQKNMVVLIKNPSLPKERNHSHQTPILQSLPHLQVAPDRQFPPSYLLESNHHSD